MTSLTSNKQILSLSKSIQFLLQYLSKILPKIVMLKYFKNWVCCYHTYECIIQITFKFVLTAAADSKIIAEK